MKAERKLSVIGSGGYIAVVIIGSFIGLLVGAHLADRIGRRANFPLFAVCSPITVVVYTQLAVDDGLIAWISTRLLRHRHFRGYGAFLTENFPARVRASGQGFAYNFGSGIAALNPTFVGLLSATLPLGQSIGVFAAGAYGLLIVAALLLPETKARELTPG